MRHRRWFALALVALTVAVAVSLLRPRGPQPCRAIFEQVQEGMTREEVIATVGGPPGDYSRGESWWAPSGVRYWGYEGWLGQDAELMVRFGPDGRADRVCVTNCWQFPSKPSLWERVCQRLGL
jgi:hypothetical protein